ncbi:MAG: hypothetical protein NTX15_01435 [Candidatus Kapabacteria bacterium]|nr:hypothetical protein [Candidatus Kapabacteria bacterium]
MNRFFVKVLVTVLISTPLSAQIDTSFFSQMPPDSELVKLGQPTREDMRRTMRELDSAGGGQFQKQFEDALVKSSQDSLHPGLYPEDDNTPPTLEELIATRAHVRYVVIDLKATPRPGLPEGFTELADLELLVIANAQPNSTFDFEGATATISTMTSIRHLYLINNRDKLRHVPPSIDHLVDLKQLGLWNNGFESLPLEMQAIEALRLRMPKCVITCSKGH